MSGRSNGIIVTAAVIERADRFLVTRRQAGVHLEGYWEFPGGKCEPPEDLRSCLKREIREELDVDIRVGEELYSTRHDYVERTVELHFFSCDLLGEPHPQIGQQMQWVSRDELRTLKFPPADAELIDRLTASGGRTAEC